MRVAAPLALDALSHGLASASAGSADSSKSHSNTKPRPAPCITAGGAPGAHAPPWRSSHQLRVLLLLGQRRARPLAGLRLPVRRRALHLVGSGARSASLTAAPHIACGPGSSVQSVTGSRRGGGGGGGGPGALCRRRARCARLEQAPRAGASFPSHKLRSASVPCRPAPPSCRPRALAALRGRRRARQGAGRLGAGSPRARRGLGAGSARARAGTARARRGLGEGSARAAPLALVVVCSSLRLLLVVVGAGSCRLAVVVGSSASALARGAARSRGCPGQS